MVPKLRHQTLWESAVIQLLCCKYERATVRDGPRFVRFFGLAVAPFATIFCGGEFADSSEVPTVVGALPALGVEAQSKAVVEVLPLLAKEVAAADRDEKSQAFDAGIDRQIC